MAAVARNETAATLAVGAVQSDAGAVLGIWLLLLALYALVFASRRSVRLVRVCVRTHVLLTRCGIALLYLPCFFATAGARRTPSLAAPRRLACTALSVIGLGATASRTHVHLSGSCPVLALFLVAALFVCLFVCVCVCFVECVPCFVE